VRATEDPYAGFLFQCYLTGHLAAAGASVVGIYTCTDPRLTGPYGLRAASVRSCVWCAPSFRKSCDRLECLTELSPDRVWPVVRSRLIPTLESAA